MRFVSLAIKAALAVSFTQLIPTQATAGTFYSLADSNSTCSAIPIYGGKQYTEGFPTNGVPPTDSWSALYRWQGRLDQPGSYADWKFSNFSQVYWDIGRYTGLTINQPWWVVTQMGRVAQQTTGADPSDYAMPGIQAYCGQVGMLLNTWWTPHITVDGGTPNDMFGYAWSANNQPLAFKQGNADAELVLEANIAMTGWAPYSVTSDPSPGAYIALFVYLRDTSNLDRPPLGVLAATHGTGNQSGYLADGIDPRMDYCNSPTDCGGWFVSAPIISSSGESPPANPSNEKWITVRNNIAGVSPSSETQVYSTPFFDPNNLPTEQHFRIHITPTNLGYIVNRTNAVKCPGLSPPSTCLYSTAIADYKVEYAGVIMELLYDGQWGIDSGYAAATPGYYGYWVENDSNKDQVAVAARMSSVKISRYVP